MKPTIVFVMGVSGSGKSTIGKLLAQKLGYLYFDGDDYHPPANVDKMSSGQPLNDEDRKGWLKTLNTLAMEHSKTGAVIACSALKTSYRDLLSQNVENSSEFIYLEGSFDLIYGRIQARKNHFMPPALLKSQFKALEEPNDGITVSIAPKPEKIVEEILAAL